MSAVLSDLVPRSWQSDKLGQPRSRNQVLRPKPSLMVVDFASLLKLIGRVCVPVTRRL